MSIFFKKNKMLRIDPFMNKGYAFEVSILSRKKNGESFDQNSKIGIILKPSDIRKIIWDLKNTENKEGIISKNVNKISIKNVNRSLKITISNNNKTSSIHLDFYDSISFIKCLESIETCIMIWRGIEIMINSDSKMNNDNTINDESETNNDDIQYGENDDLPF